MTRLRLPAFIFLFSALLSARGEEPRDFVFFMSSDPHVGLKDKKDVVVVLDPEKNVREKLKGIAETIGTPFPTIGPLRDLPAAKVAQPLGLLIAGDLTDDGENPTQWPRFDALFPYGGLEDGRIPLYLSAGNHDGSPTGATRKGIVARNRQAFKDGRLSMISENGFHYAWSWQGVHFVCVNLCPADTTDAETPFQFGKPDPGSWNDPLGALTFLTEYLKTKVGTSGEPVFIWHHYGFCEGFNFDWNWWSAKQRRAFYDAIKCYNIAALLHGHTHAPAHYRWPDAKSNPREVKRLFGETVPADMKSYEVFSGGSVSAGTFFVFRINGNQLIAAHRGPKGWSTDANMFVVKSIAADRHAEVELEITSVPQAVRESLALAPFYTKYISAQGFPVLGSEKVSDAAMREAARIVNKLLDGRDDVRQAMIKNKIRLAVMAKSEQTTDIPEHSDLTPKAYWNQRARGLGATRERPAVSCAEENLLHLEGDRYPNENILIHEFAHSIHEYGLNTVDPKFNDALIAIYKNATIVRKLWRRTYAESNYKEYWAEGVQSYFDCNDNNNALHNEVCTRELLANYDPEFFALIDDAFKHNAWRYERPGKSNPPRPALKEAKVTVVNRSGVEVALYWLNGEREYQNATIAEGGSRQVDMYVTDRWRAKIKGREQPCDYRVEAGQVEWIIK